MDTSNTTILIPLKERTSGHSTDAHCQGFVKDLLLRTHTIRIYG